MPDAVVLAPGDAVRDAAARTAPDGAGGLTFDGTPVGDALAGALYAGWYAGLPPAMPEPGDGALARALLERVAARDGWDPGWVIERPGRDTRVIVRRDVERRAVWPGGFARADGAYGPAPPGTPVRILLARTAPALQQGFFFAHGDGVPDEARRLTRVYLNVRAGSAVELTHALLTRLRRFGLPFTYKVADTPALASRRDSAVLFVEARHFPLAADLLVGVLEGLADPLDPAVPPLTKPLAPGVAVADDPGLGRSFGQDRCDLVAQGLVGAVSAGTDPLAAVAAAFEARGVSLDRPWLRAAGAPDPYELPA